MTTIITPRLLAIIGTAGRDKTKPMNRDLWQAMRVDRDARLRPSDILVSGGAAWSDHLAVDAFLYVPCGGLHLYLPAPFEGGRFVGPPSSSASAANYYHQLFHAATGVDGLREIAAAIEKGAVVSFEPARAGYSGMFGRNAKVALGCSSLVAYTFGEGAQPADGGTLDTWKKAHAADRVHVPLAGLLEATLSSEKA